MSTIYQENLPADSTLPTATGLASLASSSTRVAGYEIDAISNRSTLDLTHLWGGKLTVGTTPAINTLIDIWLIPALSYASGTPVWPDVFDGTASAETATSAAILAGCGTLMKSLLVDATTSDRPYYFTSLDIAQWNGGTMPWDYTLFFAHNNTAAWNATGGNFLLYYTRERKIGN